MRKSHLSLATYAANSLSPQAERALVAPRSTQKRRIHRSLVRLLVLRSTRCWHVHVRRSRPESKRRGELAHQGG